MVKLKKTLAILLAVCFLASITAAAVSARGDWDGNWKGDWNKYSDKDFRYWKGDDYYKYRGHTYKGHYDDYGNFWHKHGHYNMKNGKMYWNKHWHIFGYEHGPEKWYTKYDKYDKDHMWDKEYYK